MILCRFALPLDSMLINPRIIRVIPAIAIMSVLIGEIASHVVII